MNCTVLDRTDDAVELPPKKIGFTAVEPSASVDATRTLPSGSDANGTDERFDAATPSGLLDNTPNQN